MNRNVNERRFDTIAIHGMYGMQEILASKGCIFEPAYMGTAQHFETADAMAKALKYQQQSWIYSRIDNPTVYYLEQVVNKLESYDYQGSTDAVITSSGMAAIALATGALLTKSKAKEATNFVAAASCYGGTFMLFNQRYHKDQGHEVRWIAELNDTEAWANAIDENTRFLYIEVPVNPTLEVADIAAISAIAKEHNIPLIVDATVATPALLRPLNYGADIVVHSLSKAMAFSGSSVAGAIIAKYNINCKTDNYELKANFAQYVKRSLLRDLGPCLSPFHAYLILNDLRTLRTRVAQTAATSLQLAEFLNELPAVTQVNYPGLPNASDHYVAKTSMHLVDSEIDNQQLQNCYGNLLSFTVGNTKSDACAAFDKFKLILRANDLGRIKTIATIPAIATNFQQGVNNRQLATIPENLIRLSVGGEHVIDLLLDLEQALRI